MESLKTIEMILWFNIVVAVLFGTLLILLIRRRDLWLRYTASEAAFNLRLRSPQRLVDAIRRFEESRAFICCIGVVLAFSLFGAVVSGRVYKHTSDRIKLLRPASRKVSMHQDEHWFQVGQSNPGVRIS